MYVAYVLLCGICDRLHVGLVVETYKDVERCKVVERCEVVETCGVVERCKREMLASVAGGDHDQHVLSKPCIELDMLL